MPQHPAPPPSHPATDQRPFAWDRVESCPNNTHCRAAATDYSRRSRVGPGQEAYWRIQNSFGSVWGEEGGYFRIKRSSALQGHEHNLGIERDVSWAMPAHPQRQTGPAGAG